MIFVMVIRDFFKNFVKYWYEKYDDVLDIGLVVI